MYIIGICKLKGIILILVIIISFVMISFEVLY